MSDDDLDTFIDKTREELKKITPFSNLSFIEGASCDSSNNTCTVDVRLPGVPKDGSEVAWKDKRFVFNSKSQKLIKIEDI